ncbi:reverse transcriptase/maturase family protein [Bradyrhizobium sp. YR681]|uniref:reverse transcriptase/maturase family protein n=1 Tax=Bradyrhizobium sp. YR681 TaxID=1144344 RepID=UPI000315265C|nr:reverse transcriptase/maturase family protein [Bradyrhizobium sp. YR681]
MTRRYRNLIGKITSPRNMEAALRLTAAGKRLTPDYLDFKEFSALNLADLGRDMASGRYRAGAPHEFFILDPKRRLIQALPFRDRIAQQALCLVIGPIFDAAMLPRAYACRTGKGTHAGVVQLQSDLRREARGGELHFLKTDFSRYFASIERGVLWRLIEAKISCRATLELIEAMVPRTGTGLPIGSLTSQIFANVYAGATLDRHLQQHLGERLWYRYMDDLVVLGREPAHLRRLKDEIESYAARELGLRFSKWQVSSVSRGINFLGYRIWANHKLLRRDSVIRARRTIAALRARGDDERLREFLAAWLGHASWADSGNLIRSLGLPQQRENR